MAVRAVLHYPSPWLRARSQPLDRDQDPWRGWLDDLADTLAAHSGVGIAAPQIGVLKRLFLVDERRFRTPPEGAGLRAFLNPYIVEASGRRLAREGCLSIPGYVGETQRARRVVLRATDPTTGEPFEEVFKGFRAVVIQHEVDHLHGILFLDRLVHPREALRLRRAAG